MQGRLKLTVNALLLLAVASSVSCFGPSKVDQLNERIDRLEITSDEIVIRAQSMNELELVVSAMEKRQEERLRSVKMREEIAKKRVEGIESELAAMEKKIKDLEEESNRKKLSAEDRLTLMIKEVEETIDLKPDPGEANVVLIERMIKTVRELREENAKLKEQLAQSK